MEPFYVFFLFDCFYLLKTSPLLHESLGQFLKCIDNDLIFICG